MIERDHADKSSLAISKGSHDIVRKMREHDLLSMGKRKDDSSTADIYLLAVVLGLGSPTERMVSPDSFTRIGYFEMEDKALICAAFIGFLDSSDELTKGSNLKEAFNYWKQFTDAGFQRIDKFAAEGSYDPDLMVRKMLDYVESKYDEVIKE